MLAKHLKMWLTLARKTAKEDTTAGEETTEGKESTESAESMAPSEAANWERVVNLVQTEFREVRLAEEATWQAAVLIPKGGKTTMVLASWR